ncbi:NAD(P)H-binding protein [Massilia sp. W12]|uniref:NAD(P)H-binding protein n=1 Tax=Massilia sp. W12 TaxID=3126507 RepID=UPI0030D2B0E9
MQFKVLMMGATGAVGGQTAATLLGMPQVQELRLLGRRPWQAPQDSAKLRQDTVDVLNPASYQALLPGHHAAICTLGVGQPSQITRAEFLRIDRDAVLAFGQACKAAGVQHFSLLSSVGANAASSSFYLRSKGELEDGLRALGFARLSLFQPSMILTPHNRYGFTQAVTLALWPGLSRLLHGAMRKYRGVQVATLGRAIAHNLKHPGQGCEILQWDQFEGLGK